MVGRDRKTSARRRATKKYLPSRPVRGTIIAVATEGGRPCGRRPQTNDADEPTDAIERRLRPALWQVHLSPPIDPKRYAFSLHDFAEAMTMSRTLVTMVATFALALAAGIIAVALNGWFGSGDLVPFGVYCIPFALLAAPAIAFVFGATKRLPVWLASACAFMTGLVFGWLGTFAIAISLGPWFGAMSVPMLQAWCTSAAFVFSAAIVLRRAPLSRGAILAVLGLASLSILASIGFRPTISIITGN